MASNILPAPIAPPVGSTPDDIAAAVSPLDDVTKCKICKELMKSPRTLKQCLHSFCKQCLDSVTKTDENNQKGWLCPECNTFSTEDNIRDNDFISDLVDIATNKRGNDQSKRSKVISCKQCLTELNVTKKCSDCKIELCENCQVGHLRIPLLQDHKMVNIAEKDRDTVIDKLCFCEIHSTKPVEYHCITCNVQTCSACNISDHNTHKIETVNQAAERFTAEMENESESLDESLTNIQSQIDTVSTKMEETREMFSGVRMDMDEQVDKLINRLKALKASMEEDVNEEETKALDILQKLKQGLQNHESKLRNARSLSKVTVEYARHASLVNESQSGLLDRIKKFKVGLRENKSVELCKPHFHPWDSETNQELRELIGEVRYDREPCNIDSYGTMWHENTFMCDDFSTLCTKKWQVSQTINLPLSLRANIINKCIWVCCPDDMTIFIYNSSGELMKTVRNDHKLLAIKKAANDDMIAAGLSGLYLTDDKCSLWTKIADGEYCDLFMHGNKFSALCCHTPQVVTFQFVKDFNSKTKNWLQQSIIDLQQAYFGQNDDSNYFSSLAVESNNCITIANITERLLGTFDNTGVLQKVHGIKHWEPVVCGVDRTDKILVANSTDGKLYATNNLQHLTPGHNTRHLEIKIKCKGAACVTVNSEDNSIWTLHIGSGGKNKLVKHTASI